MKNIIFMESLIGSVFIISPVLWAGLYKWVDENGVTHLSDSAAPQNELTTVEKMQGDTPNKSESNAANGVGKCYAREHIQNNGGYHSREFLAAQGFTNPSLDAFVVSLAGQDVLGLRNKAKSPEFDYLQSVNVMYNYNEKNECCIVEIKTGLKLRP